LPLRRHFVPSNAVHPYFINEDPESCMAWQTIAKESKADIFHFHHFFRIGTNVLNQINNLDLAKVSLLTLHEYLAICLRDGQLVRRSGALCSDRSPLDCLNCNQSSLRDPGMEMIQLRNEIFKKLLTSMDHLISPSKFLMQQFVDWGINPRQISQVPNVIARPSLRLNSARKTKQRVLFISGLTKIKGIETFILAAENILSQINAPTDVYFEIWGNELPADTERKYFDILDNRSDRIELKGYFERAALDEVLSGSSLVVCPSLWFENRPTVLDEAASRDIPTLSSDIGGMNELSVRPLSWTFRAGDAMSLSESILEILSLEMLPTNGKLDFFDATTRHIDLYSKSISVKI